MSAEDRNHNLEQDYLALTRALGETRGELRWIRYLMLAILAVLLMMNTFLALT